MTVSRSPLLKGARHPQAAGLGLLALIYLASCANPLMPTGGPADQTPPVVLESSPAADAVNVDASSIRIRFSEYINTQTFVRAFSMLPQMEGRFEFDWSGHSVTIDFSEPLRPNTTYIITIDKALRDDHGVGLSEPIVIAFSTGPTINRGEIAGDVVDPVTGEGIAEMDVYAYAVADSTAPFVLSERPDYRTQTDDDGRFVLSYLNEQPYFVLAVQDRNRNRQPDATEMFAVPPQPFIIADSTAANIPLPWFATQGDTLPPAMDRIRSLSNQRIEIRFSEPVRLSSPDPASWALQDSLTGQSVPIQSIYTLPATPRLVFAHTEPLQAQQMYRIQPSAVVDTAGNPVRPGFRSFTASAQPDTSQPRVIAFIPDTTLTEAAEINTLLPVRAFGARFTQPLSPAQLEQAISLQDTSGVALLFTFITPDGTAYYLAPEPPLEPGRPVEIRIDAGPLSGADTVYTRTFEYLPLTELGEISGYVTVAPDATTVVDLYRSGEEERTAFRSVTADTAGRFIFPGLPEGNYRLRAFIDRNTDLRWSGGQTQPYMPAEPVAWTSDSLRVRPRWETALPDTFRIPLVR